ncbi:MAG: hypothetical protein SOV28_06310 [Bacteroidaceae bacterium]|nr:hypothetical protein [Bacteroidaceae bacterium]
MQLSTINEISQSRDIVDSFGGYNHNVKIADGEFYDMKNLTSANYPVLSPRGKRGIYEYPYSGEHNPNGLIEKDSLCYVDGNYLYVNEYKIEGLILTDSPKQLISMGAYIIIMPDKKYINTKDLTDYGDIEASYTSSSTVSYEMCSIDGQIYEGATVSPTEPSNPEHMDYWIDTSSTPHSLKQYSSTSGLWVQIPTCYVRISAPSIAAPFKQYDGVKISGIDSSITQLKDLEGQTSVLWEVHHDEDGNGAGDYIVVVGFLDMLKSQEASITIERRMPNLDFIIESENRLWGCRYGEDINGNVVNEIYASKLGDFKNWNCFMGLATDSYTASCGTDGQWTGAITHLGYPLFFKENFLHKVYGNYPSNFQIKTTACRGVSKGAGKSLAIVNETLFYKSRNGVCSYDGSLPSEISSVFGDIHYSGVDESAGADPLRNGAVAVSFQNKYYISMKSEKDELWYLFSFDTSLGMWHKEDNTRVDDFCSCNGELYFIDHESKEIKTMMGTGIQDDETIEWMAETGALGTDMPDKKYISRLLIRMSMAIGAVAKFYIQYDSQGWWSQIAAINGTTLRSFSFPIRPKRCDHFKLRIVGYGECKIYSISKTIEQGSDMY